MKSYPTKFDLWLMVVLGGAAFATVVAAVGVLISEPFPASLVGLFPFAVLVLAFWLVLTIRYDIAPPELIVRAGFFRWRVPIAGVRSIRNTHNPLSSPAASLDRLLIEYEVSGRSRWLMISPRDKAAFLQDLRAAGAEFQGP